MYRVEDLHFHPENQEIIELLIADLQENKKDFVPFVGAGMSQPIFPLWRKAISDIMEETHISLDIKKHIENLLDIFCYEEAAAELKKELGNDRWMRKIKSIFASAKIDDKQLASMPVSLLPQIFSNGVVATTNFDQVLEYTYRLHRPFEDKFTMAVDSPDQRGQTVRNQAHYLVKLHGCITAADRIVLTKEQYNGCYGENLDSKNAAFLQELFQSKIMLFLGCGLEQDRTLQLIKKIADSEYRPHYAILEMKVPMDSDEFFKRETQLSDLNIRCIWYRQGQHEYIKTILQLLLPPDVPELSSHSDCLGRDIIVQEIIELLCTTHVEVRGEPGIGKTTVCEEVLRRCGDKFRYIVRTDFSQTLTKDAALFALLSQSGLAIQDTVPLETQIEQWHNNHPNLLLYMDNLEDPLEDSEFKQWFLNFISITKWRILYSSRQHVSDRRITAN